ncbi:DNA/RNA polymerase [Lichtheimia hyalospora FSU 10163]|nr:DNA/RNA polymerase [Lichtheimia hyalospora FSU 10163]
MSDLPASLKGSRCIVHIDLDCFYCQVEMARLGVPREQPAAVRQWDLLIAVNYPARRAGVKKRTSIPEALKICPDIKLLHVATYGPGDSEPQYYPSPRRSTHKVSLDPYRAASKNIFKIFRKYAKTIQRIGLDEGFLDLTDTVNKKIIDEYVPHLLDKIDDQVCSVDIDWDELGVTIGKEETTTTWKDLQLAVGARIAKEIRQEISDELKYTCSAGIAHNKVVAKLGSSQNKPNNQTVVRTCGVQDFMHDMPFMNIRNLGGKLGNEVEADLGISTAGDVWQFSLEDLQQKFGESTGTWIYNIVRGEDDEEVTPTKAPKSLMAAKSFVSPVTDAKQMQIWIGIMSAELHNRIMTNLEDFSLWPKTLTVHFRATHDAIYRTKSLPMYTRANFRNPEALSSIEGLYPCIGFALQATGLVADEAGKHCDISQFFIQNGESSSFSKKTPTSPSHTPVDELTTPSSRIETSSPANEAHSKKGSILEFYSKQQDLSPPSSSSSSSPTTTNKRKPGPLDQFCKRNNQHNNQEDGKHWTCDKCFKRIPIDAVDEHTDYHFALDLQLEERNTSHSSVVRSVKRPKVEQDKAEKHLFFQPR